MPRLQPSHLIAIGLSAVLALVAGLVAGFANGDPGNSGIRKPALELGHLPIPREGLQLRSLAEPHQLRLGSAVNVDALTRDDYRAVLGAEFNTVTAETVMKWSTVEPLQGVFDRAAADRLIAFANGNDQAVYGHALVWHKQIPTWVRDGLFTDVELRDVLRSHVVAEASYFRDQVWAWDVVNEALDEDGSLRESLWLQQLGPGYIADAFRWARAADPDAELYLNDFGIEAINAKSDGLYDLVVSLLEQGVPIDGIGFQMHWTLEPLPETFVANLQRFAALGLEVAITELDVRIPDPVTPEKLSRQALVYQQAIDACLLVPQCVSFTVWGFTDAYSWVPEAYPGTGSATLFDHELSPKPAYAAVAHALEDQ